MAVRSSWTRIGRWLRLAAAAVCVLLALASAASATGRGSSRVSREPRMLTRSVVVAARLLPVGHVLTRTDLTSVGLPVDALAAGTIPDPARVVGRATAVPLAPRDVITARSLAGPGLAAGLSDGQVAITVATAGDAAALTGPGRRVDVLASAPGDALAGDATDGTLDAPTDGSAGRPAVLVAASDALVLAVTVDPDTDSGTPGSTLTIAVRRSVALRITGLASVRVFSIVASSP